MVIVEIRTGQCDAETKIRNKYILKYHKKEQPEARTREEAQNRLYPFAECGQHFCRDVRCSIEQAPTPVPRTTGFLS